MAQANGPHRPKSLKATTEIKEDPELWRDIQSNVRKMDDLYDATFYTWLRSEDNVLVTASYLQRLTGEYSLDRIEHALCWLVNGWRLESIAILIKQVTFDWITTKGDQGEMDRAQLVLALTDNWAIQFLTRLACTLLTNASTPPGPLPSTPKQHLPYSPTSSPSSPSSPTSHASLSYSTPPQAHRRMAITRRVGSPLPNASSDNVNTNTNTNTNAHSQLARAQASAMLSGASHARSQVYPSHRCTALHHSDPHNSHQHHDQRTYGGAHLPRTSQGSSKHWPKHPSVATPVFYMNKSLFMEELSRKWSFCRLSEFFQCMDPNSGISHRFKCTLLKERALKEESQKQAKTSGSTEGAPPIPDKDAPGLSSRISEIDKCAIRVSLDDQPSDVHMNEVGSETSVPEKLVSSPGPTRRESESLHPFDMPQAITPRREDPPGREVGTNVTRHASSISHISPGPLSEVVVAPEGNDSIMSPSEDRPRQPSNASTRQQVQTDTYQSLQVYSHDYNDDMNSGLRGFKGSEGHQHSRSQTVDAIMTPMNASSSHGSFAASAASASLSSLTLTESGEEKPVRRTSRPLQAGYSQPLYRHASTLSVPFTSMVMSDGSSSTSSTSGNASSPTTAVSLMNIHSSSGPGTPRERHDSTSAKRKNSMGVNLANSSFSSSSTNSSSSSAVHQATLNSSSAIFPGPRRTSTSASTTNEDLKRVRCSRQNSSTSDI
ncbi:hypothetical protein CPC16_007155 [Podila verticillata]|nr:hypothetical protein BGZ59_004676 [Podila verticillata]KAF9387258.1 hypothetical protein CPC16_007155 [Podila verticillata]